MSGAKPVPPVLREWAQSITGSWGVPNGDHEIVESARATLARVEVQAA